ncbi:hypothetical protein [Agromyces sp. NPDC049794]|uniref:hypothetical protein n=1 Tax=unclassified Agromyces TaxID=2639701 RepID=UPI0033E25886
MTDEIRPDDPIEVPEGDKKQPAPDEEKTSEETPGSPRSDAPLTDSTEGGLDGGDPGVEE